jgi:hypothetical protein
VSTKQQTTSSATQSQQQSGSSQGGFSNIYDPASMQRYQAAQGQALGGLQSWAQNPLQNSFFNTLAQMQRQNVGQQGQSAVQSLLQNALTSGFGQAGGGGSPYMQSLMAQQSRAQSGQQAQGFNALLAQMPQYQLQALSALQGGFNPLQTGGTQNQSYKGNMTGQQNSQQTQQMSGLGTWLPQLIGGALGAAGGIATGGLSTAMKAATSGGFPSPSTGPGGFGSISTQNPFIGFGGAAGPGAAGMNLGGINFGSPGPMPPGGSPFMGFGSQGGN